MTLQQFINTHNGKYVDFDGYYGAQCMDLAQFWSKAIGGPRLSGNAKDVINQTGWYSRMPTPQPGDLVIFHPNAGNGYYGHIAVFVSGDGNRFTSFDQNYPTNSPCHLQAHTGGEVMGYLRPKTLIGDTVDPALKKKYDFYIAWLAYQLYLGRTPATTEEALLRQNLPPEQAIEEIRKYAIPNADRTKIEQIRSILNS